ncbi:unnamed protein product [Candida verbasci]|uniref:RNB domain-containing protein n=1 Tax=Candida verbasci TaxID=1227364 RepID=A0A9W4TYV0_9ASCO|nr:unnamed protein product [Candida verbasci]
MSSNPPPPLNRNSSVSSKNGKNLFVAHRRSPSDLTSLMAEQYELQKQLESNKLQQQQLLSNQNFQQQPQQYSSHSRSGSINNRSAPGTAHGHSRRHSLGLDEAKRLANDKRNNKNSPTIDSAVSTTQNFTFPPQENILQSPRHGQQQQQQSFKFPPPPNSENNLMPPPTINFQSPSHNRKGSHYRSNSRGGGGANMDINWRSPQQQQQQPQQQQPQHKQSSSLLEPPLNFVPGHRSRNSSYGGSTSSLQQFLPNQQNNNQQGNTRKSLFAPYLAQASLPDLINEGRLVTGTLRVNKKNRSDAYVSTDGLLDADIFICGSKDRNRALENDLVAVELLIPEEVWESKKEKEEKKRRKDNTFPSRPLTEDIHNDATSNDSQEKELPSELHRQGSLKTRPTLKKNDDVEVEGQSLLLTEEEEINDQLKPLYAGHVVAVVDRIPGQLFAGTLGLLRPAQAAQAARDKKNGTDSSVVTPKNPKIVWFKPIDKKVPLIAIPTEQAPKDFVENNEKYSNQLFVASIKRWPITSLHPFGTLVSKLGPIDSPDTEVDSILRDNNFLCDEYPDDNEGVTTNVYDLPEPIFENRVEYLNDYIIAFTQNGEFTDIALHVKRTSNTKIELGVHIADVSYFIKPGSPLDRKSKKRSSSVFLPQKSVHLYPKQVNKLISFKENEKNLAISVVFEIDTTNFEVEDLYIHESVIVPKQLVSFDSFDQILENKPIEGISSATSDYIKTLSLISKEFRRHRLENRSLGIEPNLTLLDQLDDEKVRLNLNIFKDSLAFDVISEIIHKVNHAIAVKIHSKLGDQAFLRRHPLPTLQKMETFVKKANNLGFKVDTTTSATLQNSILSIDDPVKRQCVETLLFKCMSRSKYYVAGKQDSDTYFHYYFNLPLYTHFNAPLRRYGDLIVHRQLKQVLSNQFEEKDLDSLKAAADYCNFKKDCASQAQEQAIHLLLSQTINEVSESAGQLLCMGTVVQVYESSFDVFISEFGIEKRVHGDQLPLVKAEFDKTNRILELYWEKGVDVATYIPQDEKSSLSYRNSIKNKYRTSSLEAAKLQNKTILDIFKTDSIIEKLSKLNLEPPKLLIPQLKQNYEKNSKSMPNSPTQEVPKNLRTNSSSVVAEESEKGLAPYIQDVTTKIEGENHIQVIKELSQVPILLRAEIGLALPCLTVRVLNPFTE